MAEGLEPDERDRQKNESIRLWLKNVELATHQGPQVHDRGLISNPDLTSFAHDPTLVTPHPPTAADPIQAPSLLPLSSPSHHPTSFVSNPPVLLPHVQRNPALAMRSASLSLSSKKTPVILSRLPPSRSSLRHAATVPPLGKSGNKPSPVHHQRSALPSAQSQSVVSGPSATGCSSKEMDKHKEESSKLDAEKAPKEIHVAEHVEERKEGVSAKDDVVGGDEQRLRELRSLARTRQTSLSPLPAPTAQPSLPTFNLSDIQALPQKRPWLKKKLPTVTGVRPRVGGPLPSHVKLFRATTSPGELNIAVQPQSAPSSPKTNRAVRGGVNSERASTMQDNQKGADENTTHHTLERCKSFSHDDITQLQQQLEKQNIGGVSPAESIDEGAPGSRQSLAAEGGSSEESAKDSIELSGDKVESVPSDEAAIRDNSAGLPSSQSLSPVLSHRGGDSDSMDQSPHYHSQTNRQLQVRQQEDHKKVASSSMCPLSPPSLKSPRAPHSPLMRQRNISRSPSPSLPHTPPTSPLHKSWVSGSHAGTEPGNVISKQKLKLLNEGQTFSFDTSEDSDFTKLSKQPKFLLKKPLQSCPVSPPPSLLSPPSSQRSPTTSQQYMAHHQQQISLSDSATSRSCKSPSPTRLKSPVLSEQLLLRRGSTPVSLSMMQTQQGGGSAPALPKPSSRFTSNRSSISSLATSRPVTLSPQATRKFASPKSIDESKKSNFSLFSRKDTCSQTNTFGHHPESGPLPEKGSVNRQDSGLGTLSTISNKFNL